MTGPRAPDDREAGGELPEPAGSLPAPGSDPLDLRWARLLAFWALVLRRFRGYALKTSGPAAERGTVRREDDGDR